MLAGAGACDENRCATCAHLSADCLDWFSPMKVPVDELDRTDIFLGAYKGCSREQLPRPGSSGRRSRCQASHLPHRTLVSHIRPALRTRCGASKVITCVVSTFSPPPCARKHCRYVERDVVSDSKQQELSVVKAVKLMVHSLYRSACLIRISGVVSTFSPILDRRVV